MDRTSVIASAEAYLEKNWPTMREDIARLVRIPSFEELDAAEEGAPFGPGPKKALDEVLSLASAMGFATHDINGYLGFADFSGASDTQIGIIGHMDVVPAGPGWSVEPYQVTEREGYLMGRGVLDDKGPSVVALHAMKCLKDLVTSENETLPYTVRFLAGSNEESGMREIPYYRERYADPAFLFTPDAEFPVCYGEKGGFDARITSAPVADGVLAELAGGAATNAVPGVAYALVDARNVCAKELPEAEHITLSWEDAEDGEGAAPDADAHDACSPRSGWLRVSAEGRSAHAATPEGGLSAIKLLVDYLLANGLCSPGEQAFLQFVQKLVSHTDGSGVGIAASDEHFGALTVVGGTIALEDGRIVQTMDARFPTTITPEEITASVTALTDPLGATFENTLVMEPFLVEPDTPEIQALLRAYNEVTGERAEPFTIGGGTYAREFSKGASFGPEMPWLETPAWAGGMHGPDETVSIDQLKTAFKIYVLAIYELQQLDLG